MDDFEKFWEEMEGEHLGVTPERLKEIISRVLKEFELELTSVEEIAEEKGDLLATCTDKLGEKVTSLIRIWTDIEGVEKYEIEDLYEDMVKRKCTTAVFITSSYFFKEARTFAEELPIKLIDKTGLSGIIAEIEAIKLEKAFVSDMSDGDVVRYFQSKRRRQTLGKLGLAVPETIGGIDRRYAPVGVFMLKRIEEAVEERNYAYIDLSNGDVLYIDECTIKKDAFIRNILTLPQESREHLMDLVEHGELHYEHLEGKHLTILKKRGLICEHEKKRRGILGSISSEILSIFLEIISQLGEIMTTSTPPPAGKPAPPAEKRVSAVFNIPLFDQPYNLESFMVVSSAIEGFDPDPKKHEPEEIEEILNRTTRYEVEFQHLIYLPYYLCRYAGKRGERYRRLYSARFKEFFPRPGTYNILHHIINRYPELVYMILVALYVGYGFSETKELIHVFSSAFFFLAICTFTGTLFKVLFKTERAVPYYGVSIFRYGFPSLHSMVSIGAVGFVYFIEPMGHLLSLMLIPVGLIYGYSRIRIGAHSVTDVVGGAIIGLVLGIILGAYMLKIYLPYPWEMISAVLFILTPFISMIIRAKYIH